MKKLFRSNPVRFAFRGAVVFSLSLMLLVGANYAFSYWLFPLTLQYGGSDWRNMLPPLAGYGLASVGGGLLFALLFSERSLFGWYALVGIFGWFIPMATIYTLTFSFASSILEANQSVILNQAEWILQGGCLGLMFSVSRSNKRVFLWPMVIAAVVFPALAYLVPNLLLHSSLFSPLLLNHSPWFFTIMLILVGLFVAGIVLFAIKVEGRIPWLVILGSVCCPLINFASGYIVSIFASSFYFFLPSPGGGYYERFPGAFVIYGVIVDLLIGVFFGAILGLVSSLQGRSAQQPRA